MSAENKNVQIIEHALEVMEDFEKQRPYIQPFWTSRISNLFDSGVVNITPNTKMSDLTTTVGFFSRTAESIELQTKLDVFFKDINIDSSIVSDHLNSISFALYSLREPVIRFSDGDRYINLPKDLTIEEVTKISDKALFTILRQSPVSFAIIRNLFGKEEEK